MYWKTLYRSVKWPLQFCITILPFHLSSPLPPFGFISRLCLQILASLFTMLNIHLRLEDFAHHPLTFFSCSVACDIWTLWIYLFFLSFFLDLASLPYVSKNWHQPFIWQWAYATPKTLNFIDSVLSLWQDCNVTPLSSPRPLCISFRD